METVEITLPATAVPRSFDTSNPSTFLISNPRADEDQTETFLNDVMGHFRHYVVQRENAIIQKENTELAESLHGRLGKGPRPLLQYPKGTSMATPNRIMVYTGQYDISGDPATRLREDNAT